MDKSHIRAVILKLVDGLSDTDRRRLHFYCAKDVPRRISDDQTYEGTLKLMETLFDQDKINEKNFSYLIKAYYEINYLEGVKILTGYQEQIGTKSSFTYTSQAGVSFCDEIIADQEEDKSATQVLLTQVNNINQSNQIIGSKHTSINPVTINVENKPIFSPRLSKNQPFYLTLKVNKCLLIVILFLILIITILSCLLIMNISTYMKSRDKSYQLNLSQKNGQILSLKNELGQIMESLNRSMIRPGRKFGFEQYDSGDFDDSTLTNFTRLHYLNQIQIHGDDNGIESYKFEYIAPPPFDSTDVITSYLHGNEDSLLTGPVSFGNEKITKVEGLIMENIIPNVNGMKTNKSIITNLVFTSESGYASPIHRGNFNFQESFPGFYLGYATGKKNDHHIQQIQFFWYKYRN